MSAREAYLMVPPPTTAEKQVPHSDNDADDSTLLATPAHESRRFQLLRRAGFGVVVMLALVAFGSAAMLTRSSRAGRAGAVRTESAVDDKTSGTIVDLWANAAQNPAGWYSPFNMVLDGLRLPNYTADWIVYRKLKKPPVGSYQQTAIKLRQAECSFEVVQTWNYLNRAALEIRGAVKSCRRDDAERQWYNGGTYARVACFANVAGVYSSFGFMATYLSLASSLCAYTVHYPSICAATIEGLVSALAGLSVQAAFVGVHCTKQAHKVHLPARLQGSDIWQLNARRLQEKNLPQWDNSTSWDPMNTSIHELSDSIEILNRSLGVDMGDAADWAEKGTADYWVQAQLNREGEIASCVIDVTMAASYMAQFGIAIRGASRQCEDIGPLQGSLLDGPSQGICAGLVGEILFSVLQAAAFIASAVAHCSTGLNVAALCAAGLSSLLGTLGGVVYLGAGMYLGCRSLPRLPNVINATGPQLGKWYGQGLVRRLQSSASNASRNLRAVEGNLDEDQKALLMMVDFAKQKLDAMLVEQGHTDESLRKLVREEIEQEERDAR